MYTFGDTRERLNKQMIGDECETSKTVTGMRIPVHVTQQYHTLQNKKTNIILVAALLQQTNLM